MTKFQDLLELPHVIELLEIFSAHGVEGRVVGGAVRNLILGLPIHDIDIAVAASPEVVMSILENQAKVVPTGLKHGTVTAVFPENIFQITSLRSDTETFGRHANVSYHESFEEDAARRDFTINALYMDRFANIYDYFNGVEDLHQGIIRFIGTPQTRIKEDHLRVLRYFRMLAYFGGGKIHEESLNASLNYAKNLHYVSHERIREEIFKILVAPKILPVLPLIKHVLDAICRGFRLERCTAFIQMENEHNLHESPFWRLMALYHDVGIENLNSHFVLTRHERKIIHTVREYIKNTSSSLFALYYQDREFALRYILFRAALDGSDPGKDIGYISSAKVSPCPIQAKDIMGLGIVGKDIGAKLKAAETYWIHSLFSATRDDILRQITSDMQA